MRRRSGTWVRAAMAAVALALVLAGCGATGDGDDPAAREGGGGTSTTSAAEGSQPPATAADEHDPTELERWVADVYLVGHPIDDYTRCLADAAEDGAAEQVDDALAVKTNADLGDAYTTAPDLMDALIAAQRDECAELAD